MSSASASWPDRILQRRGEIGLLALCLFLFFWRLGAARLFDMDEGFYVSCARQMVVSGDYITPRLNFRPLARPRETTVPFYEKPILTYWAAAVAMRAFGISEGSARLPVAGASLAATFLIVWIGTRWIGRRAALLAGLVFATSPMVVVDGRQMTTDALLTLWFLIAMAAYWERRPLLFSAACALGVLTKGIIGLLLPLLVICVLHIVRGVSAGWHGQPFSWFPALSRRNRIRIVLAALLFLAISVPWHIAIMRAGGRDAFGRTWVQEYVIRQHVGRFKGLDIHHNAPPYTYFGYFLIGFFPWACFTPFAFRFPVRRDSLAATCAPQPMTRSAETRRFLLCWFWTVFIFFSLSAAKLPTYIVPAYPAAALMMGYWLERILKRSADSQSGRSRAALPAGQVTPVDAERSPDETDQTANSCVPTPGMERAAQQRGLVIAASVALGTATLLLGASLLVPQLPRILPEMARLIPRLVRSGPQLTRPVMAEAISSLVILLTLTLSIGCLIAWFCFRRAAKGGLWALGGVAALSGTITCIVALVAGPGYNVVNRWLLAPYQDLAILARSDAHSGCPVVYYNFGDRRPSMLYYARDYSPFERKETPLLPFLSQYLTPNCRSVAIITLRRTFESQLRAEIETARWSMTGIEIRDSGLDTWILLRVEAPNPAQARRNDQ